MNVEPFGRYTILMAKEDSKRNLGKYLDKWIEKRGHSQLAVALPSLLLITAFTSFITIAV